jgi:hypothetical protein
MGGDRKRGVPLLRIKMAGNAGDREDQIWAANYLSRPSRCRRSSFTSSRSCPKPCSASLPPTMASAAAAADRILKPYFDLAVSSPPFRFRGSGFSSLAQISRSPGFCICRRFFSWSFGGVFARGSFESFGFCARLRLLGAVFGVFDPPVRVFLCVFLACCLGLHLWGRILYAWGFMLLWSCHVVGWERSMVVRTISLFCGSFPLTFYSSRGY